MLCTRFVIAMLVFALAIPTPLNAKPIMLRSMNSGKFGLSLIGYAIRLSPNP